MRRVPLVAWCALVAAVARAPGALWPIRPDEAGFTMVARAWHSGPDSLYGPYWVDRPPLLLAVVRASDAIGGPLFVRVLGAVGCALLVLAAAGTAREVARLVGATPAREHVAVRLTAVGTTALTSNAMIDLVAAKGELLSLPFLVGSFWMALLALRTGSLRPAFLAGVAGVVALGLKQNMVGGLVFAGVLLLGELLRRRLSGRAFGRLAVAGLAGAAVPVLATLAWALQAGVRLPALWYAVYGFRSEAMQVIWSQPAAAPERRARELLVIFAASGLAFLAGWLARNAVRLFRAQPTITAATAAVLLVDLVGVAMGGSYWRPYLFGLVPSAVLVLSLLTLRVAERATPGRAALRWRVAETTVGALVVSSVVAGAGWGATWAAGGEPPTEVYTGEAIQRAAAPGDTMVIFGGRADIQLTTGMASPYPYLWSLPARTLDPGSRRLAGLLAGPRAPTWFVEWVPLGAWDLRSETALHRVLVRRYDVHGNACNGHPVYLLHGTERPPLHLGCTRPYRPRRAGDAGMGPASGRHPW